MLLAIPLQGLCQRFRNHIGGIYKPFPKNRTYKPPLPSLFREIGEMIDLSKEASSQSCILDPEALRVLQGSKGQHEDMAQ